MCLLAPACQYSTHVEVKHAGLKNKKAHLLSSSLTREKETLLLQIIQTVRILRGDNHKRFRSLQSDTLRRRCCFPAKTLCHCCAIKSNAASASSARRCLRLCCVDQEWSLVVEPGTAAGERGTRLGPGKYTT